MEKRVKEILSKDFFDAFKKNELVLKGYKFEVLYFVLFDSVQEPIKAIQEINFTDMFKFKDIPIKEKLCSIFLMKKILIKMVLLEYKIDSNNSREKEILELYLME